MAAPAAGGTRASATRAMPTNKMRQSVYHDADGRVRARDVKVLISSARRRIEHQGRSCSWARTTGIYVPRMHREVSIARKAFSYKCSGRSLLSSSNACTHSCYFTKGNFLQDLKTLFLYGRFCPTLRESTALLPYTYSVSKWNTIDVQLCIRASL